MWPSLLCIRACFSRFYVRESLEKGQFLLLEIQLYRVDGFLYFVGLCLNAISVLNYTYAWLEHSLNKGPTAIFHHLLYLLHLKLYPFLTLESSSILLGTELKS